jgi:hypothetical protein
VSECELIPIFYAPIKNKAALEVSGRQSFAYFKNTQWEKPHETNIKIIMKKLRMRV